MLKKVNKKIIKIPSHEIHNLKLIKECLKNFDKVLISTGTKVERNKKNNKN